MHTRVKICCVSSVEEANQAVLYGADAIGLVGEMPSGPGVIKDDLIRQIAKSVPPAVGTFLLTPRTSAKDIVEHVDFCGTNTVQIVNHIGSDEWAKLVELLPRMIRRVQVVHVEGGDALDLVQEYSPFVHAFLLDSGRPSAEVPELGGTGRIHDWDISSQFVKLSSKPVFLAGGINAANVQRAISTVKPYGLDLCSGVRINDQLSCEKLKEFMANVNRSNA
ncbi:MAG: phosphoribosylanthranilate isomerase [Planctomycetota bacterium]